MKKSELVVGEQYRTKYRDVPFRLDALMHHRKGWVEGKYIVNGKEPDYTSKASCRSIVEHWDVYWNRTAEGRAEKERKLREDRMIWLAQHAEHARTLLRFVYRYRDVLGFATNSFKVEFGEDGEKDVPKDLDDEKLYELLVGKVTNSWGTTKSFSSTISVPVWVCGMIEEELERKEQQIADLILEKYNVSTRNENPITVDA